LPYKILTAATELSAREAMTEAMITYQMTFQETVRLHDQLLGFYWRGKQAEKFVDVQRLMLYTRAFKALEMLPFIRPPETLEPISKAMVVTPEEVEYYTKRYMTRKEVEVEEVSRPETVRIQKHLEEVRKRLLSPVAITLTEQEEFCLLEKYLWTTLQTEVKQAIEKLLFMTIAKQYWCELIPDLEALQKLVLQMYIPMFGGMPMMMNMISLRLSALTKQWLYGLNACVYMYSTQQAQAIKTKALMITSQKRKLATKAVASGKKRLQMVPVKQEVATSEELTDETEVSTGKDAMGNDMFFMALRYAYGMPYWLRRWIARMFGMPENHKYARYFGIGCIPIRRSLWGWRRKRFPPDSFTYFNRDEYLKLMKKFTSRNRAGYSHY